MAFKIGQPFKRTGAFPVDDTLVLTKAEMLAVDDNQMPDMYFAVCSDDGKLYIYDKTATPSTETGKYVVIESGGVSDISFIAPSFDSAQNYSAGDVVTRNGKRYVANNDIPAGSFNPADWTEQDVQDAIESVSGDASMGFDYTTNIAVGGLASGTEIHATDTIASVLKRMLLTTYYPTYVAPSASLNYSVDTLAKIGATIPATTATINYNAGAIMLQGTKQADRAGAATKYYFSTSGADTDYTDEGTSSSFNVSSLTRSTAGKINISASVDYAEGAQPKDSDGRDYESPLGAGNVPTYTKSIEFIAPFYWGVSSSATVDSLAGLTEDLSRKGQKKYSYNTANQHMVIAYDSSYGDLRSILDQNNFEGISGWTKSTLVDGGITYNVYVADIATTDTGAMYTFSF